MNRMILTNDLRDDGFGAQYQSIIWSILFAEVNGHEFLYTYIIRMNNGVDNDKKFIEDAEKLMNFKKHFLEVGNVYKREDQVVYALKAPFFFKEIEDNMERYHTSQSFERIKSYFYEDKRSPFDTEHIHIAVHIRKRVKYDLSIDESRLLSDSYFLQCMKSVESMYKGSAKPLLFHIYSQGGLDAFEAYKQFPVQFHLDDDTFQSFIGMVFADVLIMCPSSMSYTAALLSNGVVIYKPFWHKPRQHWLCMQQQS